MLLNQQFLADTSGSIKIRYGLLVSYLIVSRLRCAPAINCYLSTEQRKNERRYALDRYEGVS